MEFNSFLSAEKSPSCNVGNGGRRGKKRSSYKADAPRVDLEVEEEEEAEEEQGLDIVKGKATGPADSNEKGSSTAVPLPQQPPTPEDEKPKDLDVWKQTPEEEERLYKILNGPIPSPPPTTTFVWPPTDAEEEVIQQVPYRPSCGRRLPVFSRICPDMQ